MAIRNPKNFEFKLGRQGLLLFVAGMSLMLFAVFCIGVMVGAHIDAYPEKISQSIPALIRRQLSHPAVADEKMAAVRGAEKVAPVGDDGSVAVPPPDSPVAGDAAPAVAAGGEEKKGRPPLPADAKAAAGTPPVPAAAPESPPAEAAPKYSVQVGSFKSEKAAHRFSARIKPLGFQPRVQKVELPNKGSWFRVMVDGFPSRAEAQQAAGVMAKNIKGVNGIVRPVQ